MLYELNIICSICPADVDQAVVAYAAAVREGRELELQYRVKAADGSFGWMLLRGTCIRDPETNKISGYVCTLTQGNDLINARQEAVQARKYITTVLQSSGLALLVVNLQGTVMLYEGDVPALESIGVSPENLLNQRLDKVWPHRECNVQVERMIAAYVSKAMSFSQDEKLKVSPPRLTYSAI
jgi:transcriptional regulator with PAS, ATPase and Fis domain